MDAIAPLEVPLVLVAGNNVADKPVTLNIPARNLAVFGHAYNITNAETGEVMFKVKGRPISFHSTQVFYSAAGQKLFQIKYHTGDRPHFEGERLDLIDVSRDWSSDYLAIFAVYEKTRVTGEFTRQAQLYLPSTDDNRLGAVLGPRFIIHGDIDTECSIVLRSTGQVMAVMTQPDSLAGENRGRALPADPNDPEPHFKVTVAPGMDIAAMAGMAVSFNQLHNRQTAGSAAASRAASRSASRAASRSQSRRGSRSESARPSVSAPGGEVKPVEQRVESSSTAEDAVPLQAHIV